MKDQIASMTISDPAINLPVRMRDSRQKVLVVDDTPSERHAIEDILRQSGQDIVIAKSGEQALHLIAHDDFAAIIINTPALGFNGVELTIRIRNKSDPCHIPIIFLTPRDGQPVQALFNSNSGIIDYVFKPIEPLILRSKISLLIDLYVKTVEVRRHVEHERQLKLENFRVRSEKLLAEHLLRRREERESLILQCLPIALYTAATTGQRFRCLRFTNDGVEKLTGFSRQEFLRRPNLWEARVNPRDYGRAIRELATLHLTGSVATEYRWRHADGTERHIFDQVVLIEGDDKNAHELFGMWLDVTDRKKIEQDLVHARRLESVGRITGGIVHDFRNMLSVIIGNLDLLHLQIKDNGEACERLGLALSGAQICADLASRLVAFAQRQPMEMSLIDAGELINNTVKLLSRTIGPHIHVEVHTTEIVWPVRVDRPQFEAALVNLCVNARDAMPNGGKLIFLIENVARENMPQADTQHPADYVRIRASDTGEGMSPDSLSRAFEPFFTTKMSGKGSGLGLSMVLDFVKQSKGHIEIDSKLGHGTRFDVYLPRAEHVTVSHSDTDCDAGAH